MKTPPPIRSLAGNSQTTVLNQFSSRIGSWGGPGHDTCRGRLVCAGKSVTVLCRSRTSTADAESIGSTRSETIFKMPSSSCHECDAAIRDGGTCLEHFHALLLLEHEVARDPGVWSEGRGEIAHFYAVSCYVLQHPEQMNYTSEALDGARRGLADHLAGRVSLSEQRRRVRSAINGKTRITRRDGDSVVHWPVASWPIIVTDILAGGVDGYCQRVAEWAKSILKTLEENGA